MNRRAVLAGSGAILAGAFAGCTGGGSSDDCERVVKLGGYTRDSEFFDVEEWQYISVTVENDAGYRTRGVLSYDGETVFGESVEDAGNSNSWRVFDPDHPEKIIEERTGQWLAVYEPSDSSPSTSGSVTVEVCSPSES